jgi:hypothetical protein
VQVINCWFLVVFKLPLHLPTPLLRSSHNRSHLLCYYVSNTFALPQSRLLSYFGIVSHESAFNVPNTVLGLMYYGLLLLFGSSLDPWISLSVASAAMGTSIFLAYTLTVLNELCILCWTTHVLNFLLLYKVFFSFIHTTTEERKTKSS